MPVRRTHLLAPTALAALALLAPGAAQGAKAKPCSAAKGRDLVAGKLVRMVDVGTARKHRYVVCAEGGVQRGLAAGKGGAALEVEDTAGAFVSVRDTRTGGVRIVDAVSGKARTLKLGSFVLTRPVVVDEAGDAAAQIDTATDGGPSDLVGFQPDGASYPLAKAIRTGSLKRTGTTVTWAMGTATFRADLALPDVPCAQLAGRPDLENGRVRVVRDSYPGIFPSGKRLNGVISRLRACQVGYAPPPGVLRKPVTLLGTAGDFLPGTRATGDGIVALGANGDSVVVNHTDIDDGARFHQRVERVSLGGGPVTPLLDVASGPGEPTTFVGPFVVTDAGRAATTVIAGAGSRVVAFDAAGAQSVLDTGATATSIPTASLTLSGTVASWTNDGAAKSADLGS